MHESLDEFEFDKFATELRPLIDVRIKFLLIILKANRPIKTKFCIHNIIDKISRPAKSPDLGRRLPAFSLHCRLSGFDVHFTGEIENLLAFLFQIDYFIFYGNQISIWYSRS